MKIRFAQPYAALALGALVLLGGSLVAAPARAQEAAAASEKPITLNLNNVPIKTALQLLFKSAGINNYTIAQDVFGNANIQVVDTPFATALNRLLGSVGATFTVENGSYNVAIKRPTPPPTATITPGGTTVVSNGSETSSTADQPKRFYPIPINKYDAFYIASMLGALGVVRVDVNGVIPSAFGGQTGGQGGQGGQGGFGGQGGPASGITSVGGSGGFGGGGGGFGGGGFGGGGGGFGGGRGGGGYGGGRGGGFGG